MASEVRDRGKVGPGKAQKEKINVIVKPTVRIIEDHWLFIRKITMSHD
jgi:hypothetical protein